MSVERYTSYGRGGAGNMRRPSAVHKAHEELAALAENVTPNRRRSSTWSGSSSHDGRHSIASLKNMFKSSHSSHEEKPEPEE